MITSKTIPSAAGDITLVTLVNASGASVTLSTLGAGIVSVLVPDRHGNLADVLLGYENPADYIGDGPAAGKVPGRYANRIARGRFSLDGKDFSLPINNGPNSLHGGPDGFQNHNWTLVSSDDLSASFALTSPDGDAGYPGNLAIEATYRWSEDNALSLTLTASTDAPTVLNLTNHAYWNLAGHNAGSALKHLLWLAASRYLPTDDTLIPDGSLAPVAGTPMDFTAPKPFGLDMRADFPALNYGKGYDNCWAIDNYAPGQIKHVATLVDEPSGRVLEVHSDQPGVQVYGGNWLTGSPAGKGGCDYHDYDAIAIECQDFPDAPNRPDFPSTVLRPGDSYCRHIIFKLSTK